MKSKILAIILMSSFLLSTPCSVSAQEINVSGGDKLRYLCSMKQQENEVLPEEIERQDELCKIYETVETEILSNASNEKEYAGGYISDNGDLVICTTKDDIVDNIEFCVDAEFENQYYEYVNKENVEYELVEYSFVELDNAKTMIDEKYVSLDKTVLSNEQLSLLDRIVNYGVSYKNNCVEIGIREYTTEDESVFKSIFGAYDFLTFHNEEMSVTESSYNPGSAIYVITEETDTGYILSRVSIGYKAYKKTVSGSYVYGFVTCAHGISERLTNNVYSSRTITSQNIIGTVYENGFTVSSGNVNKDDYSFIKLKSGCYVNHIDPASTGTAQKTIATLVEGAKIYKVGSTTGTTSSTIKSLNVSVVYNSYPNYVITHLVQTNTDITQGGDSGGLAYTSNLNIVGVVSGSNPYSSYFARASYIKSDHNIYPY